MAENQDSITIVTDDVADASDDVADASDDVADASDDVADASDDVADASGLLIRPPEVREVLKAKLIYAFYYGANASLTAYLPVYYRQLNMTDVQTGILASIKPFITFISAPLWGGISDRTGKHKTILLTAVVVYTVLLAAIYPFSLIKDENSIQRNRSSSSNTSNPKEMLATTSSDVPWNSVLDCVTYTDCVTHTDCVTCMTVASGNRSSSNHSSNANGSSPGLSNQAKFWLLFVITIVAFFFMATISPIMDATVVTMTTSVDYGKQRLWGALGFGVSGLVSGIAANDGKLTAEVDEKANFLPSFIIFFVLNVLVFLVCLSMKAVEGREPSSIVLQHLKVLLTTPRVLFFIAVVFIMGISSGVITWFLFLFLKDLGGSQTLLGMSIAVCCTSEVLVFLVSDRMISLLGNTKILFLSLSAFIVRLVAYSYLQEPWLVLPIELLHGLTYAAMWSTCVSYATTIAPPEVTTTVIGLLTGIHFGLGWGLGGALGGVVYQYYGPRVLFRSCAVMCGGGMVLQLIAEMFLKIT